MNGEKGGETFSDGSDLRVEVDAISVWALEYHTLILFS